MTDERLTRLEAQLRDTLSLADDLDLGIIGALLAHCLDHLQEELAHR